MMFSKQNPQTVATLTLKKKRGEEIPHGSMCPSGFRVDDLGSSAISRWEQLFDVGSTESLGPRQKSASAIFFLPETRWWFRIFCIFTPIWGRCTPILTNKFQLG